MISTTRFCLAVSVALFGLIGSLHDAADAAPLLLETVTLGKSNEHYTVEGEYPRTGLEAIDRVLADYATKSMNNLIASAEEDAAERAKEARRLPDGLTYWLDLHFTLERNDDNVFAVTITTSHFTGGAHPGRTFKTFTFLRPDGWQVFLPEIFSGRRALERISALAIRDLIERVGGPNGLTDPESIREGAGPLWENFEAFALTHDKLTLYFQEYQVAVYAAGSQQSEIPLSKLHDVLRDNWRLPAPSFDCSEADSRVEKAICSDVELARIDRRLAEAYERKLSEIYDDQGNDVTAAAREAIRKRQRDWLLHRESACSNGETACLTALYRDRMKTL